MPFVILPTNSASGGYDITNSLRFNSGSSDSLTRTNGTPTDGKKCTISFWIKKSKIQGSTTTARFMSAYSGTGNQFHMQWGDGTTSPGDQWEVSPGEQSGMQGVRQTSATLRDPSAWYHLLWYWDSVAQLSTLYINGVSQSSSTNTAVTLNSVTSCTKSGVTLTVGTVIVGTTDYYLSEFYLIDGQALTPTSFGETDEDTGIWKPKKYTGTYGTNGFYLQFKNSASLGTDTSGNGNNFTVNNLTSIDQTTDTPTNNFATLNPLSKISSSTLTEGNLKESKSAKGGVVSTLAVNKGKWYCEVKIDTVGTDPQIGIYAVDAGTVGYQTTYLGVDAYSMGYLVNADYVLGYNAVTANSYGSAFSNGDIMIIALDMDNKKMWFGKNGTWFSSGNPATGANPVQSISAFPADVTNNFQAFATGSNSASDNAVYSFNFGNPSFTISSGNADGAGFGNFEYAVPSGFYALCTKNLAQFG